MAKHNAPNPHNEDELDEEAAVRALTDLALACVRGEADAAQLAREVRRHLLKKHDDVLYDALEEARGMVEGTWALLRETIEEASGTALIRKEGAPAREVNAFAIPLFVRSTGGLKADEAFCDEQAFDTLLDSFTRDGLESPDAKVVLIRHWYTLEEMDRISYCTLQEIVREVAGGFDIRKVRPMPALERSMAEQGQSSFAPGDTALELRFMLGFAQKLADDPFYAVPKDEAKADAWFERRMERYRAWTEARGELVRRLLVAPGREVQVSFLYQDLFYGAKEQGEDELFILQVLAEADRVLGEAGADARAASVAYSQVEGADGDVVRAELRVNGAPLATFDKAVAGRAQAQAAIAALRDAFASIGVQ